MNLLSPVPRRKRKGYALIVTLAFLSVALIMYASMMNWVSTNAKVTKRNVLFNQSQAAAESTTEIIVGTMMRDFFYQSLNPVSAYASSTNLPVQANWPITFQFSDTNGLTNASTVNIGPTNWTTLPSQFSGLQGLGAFCDIYSCATPLNVGENLSATIHQQIWFGSIPIFQFAIFYNMDLEINPGASMNINGRVHSNNNIYATGSGSGTPLIFSDIVDAAQQFYSTPSPLDPQNTARSGNVVFSNTTNNPLSNAQALSLPIGTNNNPATVIGILGLPPAGTDPASPSGQAYPYNQADIIVSNSATGTLSVFYQNLNNIPTQIPVPMDVTNINIVAHTTNTYYSFATNVAFFDYRETNTVKAVQLDVTKFRQWLTNTTASGGSTYQNLNTTGSTSEGHGVNGVYVYNSIPHTTSQMPAVRVVNGAQLPPYGLTVATPFPIYVKGNYNTTQNGTTFSTAMGDTTNTYPAALMGDSITILSANWSDANTTNTSISSRNATATTINAACLEGIIPSNGAHYSGGVENFLRLLESWSGVTLTYNGSIVVLFQSQYAVSPWPGTGYVYNPATRQWAFDTNFKIQSKLPPMTPQLRAFYRNIWSGSQ